MFLRSIKSPPKMPIHKLINGRNSNSFFAINPNGRPMYARARIISNIPTWLLTKQTLPCFGIFSLPTTSMLQPVVKIIPFAHHWAILYIIQAIGFLRPNRLSINTGIPIGVKKIIVSTVMANADMVLNKTSPL